MPIAGYLVCADSAQTAALWVILDSRPVTNDPIALAGLTFFDLQAERSDTAERVGIEFSVADPGEHFLRDRVRQQKGRSTDREPSVEPELENAGENLNITLVQTTTDDRTRNNRRALATDNEGRFAIDRQPRHQVTRYGSRSRGESFPPSRFTASTKWRAQKPVSISRAPRSAALRKVAVSSGCRVRFSFKRLASITSRR